MVVVEQFPGLRRQISDIDEFPVKRHPCERFKSQKASPLVCLMLHDLQDRLNADPVPALEIDAGLVGDDHAGRERFVLPPRKYPPADGRRRLVDIQKVSDTVFIGIFRPKDLFSKSFQNKIYLLKRLGIGLIVVSKRTLDIEIVSEPIVSELSKYQVSNKDKRLNLSEEFQRRKIKNNVGGVHHTKLMTEYRENALMVLSALHKLGDVAKGSDVAKASGVSNATTILRANYYGWFVKVDKGIYSISKGCSYF